ncbi:MAG: sporulation protein YunB [Bacilli bacterium]
MIQIKQKMYLKKKNELKINRNFLIIILLISIGLCVYFVGNKLNKSLKRYASIETERFITSLINNTIDKKILNEFSNSEIFVQDSSNSDFYYTDINREVLNEILIDIISNVEDDLTNIENGDLADVKLPDSITNNEYNKLKKGIVISVPTGSLFNNSAIANLGPKIPVKIRLLGNVTGNINISAKEYGINNTLLEVYVDILVNEQIVLPISSKVISTKTKVMIGTRLIQGQVPDTMLGNVSTYTKN